MCSQIFETTELSFGITFGKVVVGEGASERRTNIQVCTVNKFVFSIILALI